MKTAARKFEFTGATRQEESATLHQIRALRALPLSEVRVGDVGGWLEHEANLSHAGECWVYPEASVRGLARVAGDSRVHDRAVVADHARVDGFTLLSGDARVEGHAHVRDASLGARTAVYGHARVTPGQDGPWLLPGIEIDFDVRYGLDYAVFGFSYSGAVFAVSQSGRICRAATWDAPRWAGTLPELRAWTLRHAPDDPELDHAAALIGLYLDRVGGA